MLSLLDGICRQILPQKEVSRLGDLVAFHRLEDGGTFRVGDMSFQCFDIHSSKEPQFGFTATFANGRRLCCLGDEPFNPLCREYAQDADWLMHEAFCTYADREPNLISRWQSGDIRPSTCVSCNACYRTSAHACLFANSN